MSINPNQGQKPDPNDPYGAYGGYAPQQPAQPAQASPDDPYNSQWNGQPQAGGYDAGTGQQYGTGQQQTYGTGQQQQQAYQPPKSAYSSTSADPAGASSLSLNPKIAAVLSNGLFWVGGLFFFFAERKNRFVRFNAAQSFLFFGSLSVLFYLISVLGFLTAIPLLGLLFTFIFGILNFVIVVGGGLAWIFLMFQAYRGVKTKIPFFGDYAEKLVARFTR